MFADRPLSGALLVTATVSVAWRRRVPVAVAAMVAAAIASQAALTGVYANSAGLFRLVTVALYSAGAYAERRHAMAGGLLVIGGLAVKEGLYSGGGDVPLFSEAFFFLLAASVFVTGIYFRSRRRNRDLERLAREWEVESARGMRPSQLLRSGRASLAICTISWP